MNSTISMDNVEKTPLDMVRGGMSARRSRDLMQEVYIFQFSQRRASVRDVVRSYRVEIATKAFNF